MREGGRKAASFFNRTWTKEDVLYAAPAFGLIVQRVYDFKLKKQKPFRLIELEFIPFPDSCSVTTRSVKSGCGSAASYMQTRTREDKDEEIIQLSS